MNSSISVCIPTFNQSQYLKKSILSAWEQSRKPDEILVYNDASTDDTEKVLAELCKTIPVLNYYTQPVNKGISGNVEDCLRAAKGDYIVRLDSDDFIHYEYISKMINALNTYPNAGYAHCAIQEIDDHDNPTRLRKLARHTDIQLAEEALRKSILGYKVAANILTFRKSALEDLEYSKGRPSYVEDYHLSVAMAAAGYSNVYLDEILASYRIWLDAGMVRQRRKMLEIKGLTLVFSEIIIPAFKSRNWSLKPVHHEMGLKARRQANCLSWEAYTKTEKYQLLELLKGLSDSSYSNFVYKLYLADKGWVYDFILELKNKPKAIVKRLLYSGNK